MDKKLSTLFFLLVIFQGFHSIEEYIGNLWDVFPPARFLTGIISDNREVGFLIANIGLFLFGIWCWLFPVRKGFASAVGFIWFWIIIEMINGIGHPIWALTQMNYEPGLITAPFLLILSIFLMRKLITLKSFQ